MQSQSARLAALALALLAAVPGVATSQERARTAPSTDRTITVAKGSRLNVSNNAGEVVLKTWDRDSLRV